MSAGFTGFREETVEVVVENAIDRGEGGMIANL